jgi:uncharacterized protein
MPMMTEGPDETFRRFLSLGQFMIQRCVATGAAIFPPRVMAPRSGETDLEWVPAGGRGVVYSFTIVAQKPPRQDYNICLIDLEEGPRLMSRLVEIDNHEISIGMAVQALLVREGDEPVLVFRPLIPAGAA